MKFITASQAAAAMGVTPQRVRQLCAKGLIVGAERVGGTGNWAIPINIKRVRVKPGPKPRN